MTKEKKHWRDRYDRIYLKDLDGMHISLPVMLPRRCDNEAVAIETIDVGPITDYINKKNAENPDFKYTWFHVISAAFAKVLILRPKMNRFISGYRIYQHRDVSLAFIVKKQFEDNAEEAVAKVTVRPGEGSPVNQIHDYVEKFVKMVRKDKKENMAGDSLNILKKLPVFLIRFFFWFINRLEAHGLYPRSLAEADPYFSSIFISNLGSIGMNADYHHLTERGTMSFFVVIGTIKKRPVFNPDGTYEMRDTLKLSFTIDERIADGYYFGNSIKMLRHLLQHPELLDNDVTTPIDL